MGFPLHSVLLVDGNCTPVQVNLFEAFGGIEKSWGDSENNRLANTKERDASIGLDNHGFRYFDPSIGRYISNDPIAYEGGFNLYVYCTNDPVNKFDPHGLFEWGVFFKEFGKNVLYGAAAWGDNARAGCAMYAKDFTGMVGTGGKQLWNENQKNLNERYTGIAEKEGFGAAVKRAAADVTGITNGQRAINGVDPVTQQKLTPQERMESGGTAVAQGAGWAAGGVGIVRGVAGGTVATAEAGSGAVAGGEGTAAATTTAVRTAATDVAATDVNAVLKAKQAEVGAKMDALSAKINEADGGYVAPEGKTPTRPAPSSTPIDPEIKPLDPKGDMAKSGISTGRTEPNNLTEKLAMEEVKANPQGTTPPNMPAMSDTKNGLMADDGWVKRQQVVDTSKGNVDIHYVENEKTGETIDFKFKDPKKKKN